MAQVRWRPQATEHLREIYETISEDNPTAARRLVEQVLVAVERLSQFPLSGRIVPEDERWRELITGNYRIVYQLRGDEVAIARVHHGKRRMPADIE